VSQRTEIGRYRVDRRQALKKLGVGGAIAVGAPLVISSFDVAHAASGTPTTPPAGQAAWLVVSAATPIAGWPTQYTFQIPNNLVTCTDGANAEMTIYWSIVSFGQSISSIGATSVELRTSGTPFASSIGPATAATIQPQPVTVNGVGGGTGAGANALRNTAFSVSARVVWTCDTPVERTYVFSKARNTDVINVA
jgi:hypothetical protein